jgi:hypothetical protein
MKKLVSLLLVASLACSSLWADQTPNQQHIDKIRKRVADSVAYHRIVFVATYDHRQLQGIVSEAEADSFVLSIQGRSTTLSYGEVERVKWRGQTPRVVWAVVGAVAISAALYGLVVLLGGTRD